MHSQPVGTLLRDWRQRRRLTQMDLALEAEISPRHLSFVETGRAQPSREMLLHLSEELEIPLRERNTLLVAAGFAPMFRERGLDDAALASAKQAIDLVLAAQKPFPAFALDRHWNIVATNHALPRLYEGVDPALLAKPNAMRLALHPKGIAPRIENLPEWRAHLVSRLRKQVELTGDAVLKALYEEVLSYPQDEAHVPHDENAVLVPMRIRSPMGLLSFMSTTTVFGTPVDVTLSEIALELFFPADEETARLVRSL